MRRVLGVGLAAVLAVAAIGLTASCASTQAKEWTGKTIAEVIHEFGAPTRTVPAGDGSTMYMWVLEHSYPQGSWGPGGSVATTSRRQRTTWTFWVNQAGTVVSWNRQDDSLS